MRLTTDPCNAKRQTNGQAVTVSIEDRAVVAQKNVIGAHFFRAQTLARELRALAFMNAHSTACWVLRQSTDAKTSR